MAMSNQMLCVMRITLMEVTRQMLGFVCSTDGDVLLDGVRHAHYSDGDNSSNVGCVIPCVLLRIIAAVQSSLLYVLVVNAGMDYN